jgi:hypothetical protein
MADLTVTIAGTERTLNQISEGGGASEYLLRTATVEYRLLFRHSKEKSVKGAVPLDRHNIELTARTYPTDANPLGSIDQAYVVIRSNPNSDGSSSIAIAETLSAILFNQAEGLVQWITDFTGSIDPVS